MLDDAVYARMAVADVADLVVAYVWRRREKDGALEMSMIEMLNP
jgi:hypothetical protein